MIDKLSQIAKHFVLVLNLAAVSGVVATIFSRIRITGEKFFSQKIKIDEIPYLTVLGILEEGDELCAFALFEVVQTASMLTSVFSVHLTNHLSSYTNIFIEIRRTNEENNIAA